MVPYKPFDINGLIQKVLLVKFKRPVTNALVPSDSNNSTLRRNCGIPMIQIYSAFVLTAENISGDPKIKKKKRPSRFLCTKRTHVDWQLSLIYEFFSRGLSASFYRRSALDRLI